MRQTCDAREMSGPSRPGIVNGDRKHSSVNTADLRGIEARDLLCVWPLKRDTRRRSHSDLYKRSKSVEMLHVFISHSWSASPLVKYAVLSFRYNTPFAFCASFLTFIFLRLWGVGDALCFIGMWIGLVCGYLWGGRASFDRTLLFFDQCCIHQDDETKKLEGIRHIGDYLTRAEGFVIFWSQDYNTRLWCIFELACFLRVNGPDNLEVWPLPILEHRFVIVLFHQCYWVVFSMLHHPHYELLLDIVYTTVTGLYCLFIEGRQRVRIQRDVNHLDLSKLECSLDSDREMIMAHIRRMYGGFDEFRSFAENLFAGFHHQWSINGYTFRNIFVTCFPSICVSVLNGRILTAATITCGRTVLLICFYTITYTAVRLGYTSSLARIVCRSLYLLCGVVHAAAIVWVRHVESSFLEATSYTSEYIVICLIIEMGAVMLLEKALGLMTYPPHAYILQMCNFIDM
ncbi:hypothetical protein FOL47_005258 [Perkinsus chesapeaki]|uniref:Uncharacterized protein n=1 Tax=Perkinsus chesapeaki TaxID=330153 RepID=A0A7J6LY31_PERCH|nr:hypothetical protein FOL47_005258 [Perkinsus chesapeaki]